MQKIFVATIFLCAMILTSTASAENWVSLGTDNLGNEYFLDTESVALEKHEGNRVKFYAKSRTVFTDKGRQKLGQENLASVVFLYAFANNNGQKLVAELSVKATALDGSLIEELTANSTRWEKVTANTAIGAVYEAAYKHLGL